MKRRSRVLAGALLLAAPRLLSQQTGLAPAVNQGPTKAAEGPSPIGAGSTAGGSLRGSVRSGETPLPGVRITATQTLTGHRYSTTSDVDGSWRMAIPEDGRYVLRTEFVGFAPATIEALLNSSSRQATAEFTLTLASRVKAAPDDRGELGAGGPAEASRGRGRTGGQSLGLLNALGGAIEAGQGEGAAAQLPSLGGGGTFAADSIAVAGGAAAANSFAGINLDEVRQRAESDPSLSGAATGGAGGGFGGFGGFGGGRGGGFGRFNPNQPHGAFFFNGGNAALDAREFAIRGQRVGQPGYASNRFGMVFAGAPHVPHLIEHDKKDYLFFTLSGQRSSTPFDQYGTVPTQAERAGDFRGLVNEAGQQIPIYDRSTGERFADNRIPAERIAPQASALLGFVPAPNLSGAAQNYERLTTAANHATTVGLRVIHSFSSTGGSPLAGLVRQYMGMSTGVQQNIHVNYNYSHTAADLLNILPDLGGRQQTHQHSLEVGYTLSRGKLSGNLTANWNRTYSATTNDFTGVNDVAGKSGIDIFAGRPVSALSYGLPSITLNQFTGLSEQQPTLQTNQTIGLAEASSWTHGKHNLRWGADFKRVRLDLLGKANSTGSFIFTGLFTEQPGSNAAGGAGNNGQAQSGSSLADLLLGLPQQTSLQAPYQKAYLRENIYDGYVQDDWRALPSLTFLIGLRYEYFSPYSEKNDRLATVSPANDFSSVTQVVASEAAYPRTLIYPERNDLSPRIGFAWRAGKNTVLRGGFGVNHANGQYAKFVQQFAFQPPFADVQTNEATSGASISLAHGFPAPQTVGNYAVNKHYRLPYVQVWNLDVQKTFPMNIVLNAGYNGSKGTRLDIVDAPGRSPSATLSGTIYDYEDAVAFSNFNALTLRLRKRMQRGVALGATYTYSHSIDNASSVGGVGDAVAQNWQNLLAEESNSSFDLRHNLKGDFVYELPFGADKTYFTRGRGAHLLEGLSLSGNYVFSSGSPLTPHYQAAVLDVARGSAGSLRPDRVAGTSTSTGGGSVNHWFNTSAFQQPAGVYGTASRYSIAGPGTVSFNASVSKTISFTETRSLELRATANNALNTVQYSGVDTTIGSATYGRVISAASMRQFTFTARYRY